MLMIFTLAASAFALSGDLADQAMSAARAASQVEAIADQIDTVNFYFLSRTGKYSLDEDQFVKESTIGIRRECGNNCARYLRPVVDHLRDAKVTKCQPGQQDVLIKLGDKVNLYYSFSGRQIRFNDQCFFNRRGIGSVVENSSFIFH